MRATIRDRSALATLEPGDVTRYLERHGWIADVESDVAYQYRRSAVDGELIVRVPKRHVADFAEAMSSVLGTLEEVEGRSQFEIYEELRVKTIVVLCDASDPHFPTSNVIRLQSMLGQNPWRPIYYQAGPLGFARKSLFGVFESYARLFNLLRPVAQTYQFLCQTYETGDRIFIFGGGSGAFVARLVTSIVSSIGIFEPNNDSLLPYALDQLKKRGSQSEALRTTLESFCRPATIHFLGLWDTTPFPSEALLPWEKAERYRGGSGSSGAKVVRNAVAIDERRLPFRYVPWQASPDQDAQEVWFAGAHADVAGGYPKEESGLSDVALEWMLREAMKTGLHVSESALETLAPNPLGQIHDSMVLAWRINQLTAWLFTGARHPFSGWRTIPDHATIHPSVFSRMESVSYRPKNLARFQAGLSDKES